jgi:alkylation response protein AidB-like acyl-CoA dehydrogenase
MDVLPNADEAIIAEAAATFLSGECTPALVRAAEADASRMSARLWGQMAEGGWLGVSLPEDVGGQGLPLSILGLVFEECGRHLAPVPLLGCTVAALIVGRHGTPAQRALLRDVVGGGHRLTCAIQEPSGRWGADQVAMTGARDGDRIVLSGTKAYVTAFEAAGHCLTVFRLDGALTLALVPTDLPGLTHTRLVPTGGDAEGIVRFDNVRIPTEALVGTPNDVAELFDFTSVLTASLMVGAAHQAVRRAADYAKERQAFGQPIGAFQAIQHLAADALIGVDGAQLLTREALWRLGEGLPAGVEVAQAKSFANEHCLKAVRIAQQIHGGIGFIEVFDQQLWYRRVTSWTLRAGTIGEHRDRIAAALLDNQGQVRLGISLE